MHHYGKLDTHVLTALLAVSLFVPRAMADKDAPSLEDLARQVESIWTGNISTAYTQLKAGALADMMVKTYGDKALPQFERWCADYPEERNVIIQWSIRLGSEKGDQFLADMFLRNYRQANEEVNVVIDMRSDRSAYRKGFSDKENACLFALRIYEATILANSNAAEIIHSFLVRQKSLTGRFLGLDVMLRLFKSDSDGRLVRLEALLGLPFPTTKEVFLRHDVLPRVEGYFAENSKVKDALLLYLKQVLLSPYVSLFDMQLALDRVGKWDGAWLADWIPTIQTIQSSSEVEPSEKGQWLRAGRQ